MRNANLMGLGAVVVVAILILSYFTIETKQEIEEINEVIEDVKNKPLSVQILTDANSGTSPLAVNFKTLLMNNKGEVEYFWDFGDGNISTEETPSYTFGEKGTYTCNLTLIDGNKTVYDSTDITVFPNNPPKIKILCDTTAFRPARVSFDAETFDPEGEELEYKWVLKHPLVMGGYQPEDTFNTKSFSKLLIRKGRYVVELTVTDESGNKVTDYELIQVEPSKIEGAANSLVVLYTYSLPGQLALLWNGLNVFGLEEYVDNNYLDMPPVLQKIINAMISLSGGRIQYEPPIPKAELLVSEIPEIDLSSFVDGVTGEVSADAIKSSSFTILNNDTINTARNVYITLDKPFSDDVGIDEVIEVKELTVGLDVGPMSNKMFYNGEYTAWQSCYNIEKLAPGDLIDLGITVTLEEGSTFTKGTYECTLYLYQEKYLDKAEYVDEIPFTIIL